MPDNTIININAFNGGMTLREKIGEPFEFHKGSQLDWLADQGKLSVGLGITNMTVSASADVLEEIPYLIHAIKDDARYFFCNDDRVLYQSAATTLNEAFDCTGASTDWTGLAEYKNYLIAARDTTLVSKNLTGAVTADWIETFKTGLTSSTYHPMKVSMNEVLYFGNGNVVGMGDDPTSASSFLLLGAGTLTVADNWQVRCLEDFGNLYLAVGVNYLTSSYQPSKAKILLWDRSTANTTQWQDEIILPEFPILAMKNVGNYLWIWCGKSANVYVVAEGSRTPQLIYEFQRYDPDQTFEVYPGAVTLKNNEIYFGLSDVSTASDERNPSALYSFPADPNKRALNIRYLDTGIGEVIKGVGTMSPSGRDQVIYFGFKEADNDHRLKTELTYANAAPYSNTGIYESLLFTSPPDRRIRSSAVGLEFDPLPAGCNLNLYYKSDGDSSWTQLITNFSTTGAYEKIVTSRQIAIPDFSSIKFKITLRGSATANSLDRPFIKRLYLRGNFVKREL